MFIIVITKEKEIEFYISMYPTSISKETKPLWSKK